MDRLQSDPATLTVVSRTRIVEFADRDIIDLVQGGRAQLECRAEADPKLTGVLQLTWSHNGSLVTNTIHHGPGHTDLEVTEAGDYQCVASSDLDTVTSGVVRVRVRPVLRVNLTLERPIMVEGERLRLECGHDSEDRGVEVTWYRDDRENISSGLSTILEFEKAVRSHSGTYTCNVNDGVQSVNSTGLPVTVYKKTFVNINPREYDILVGDKLTLTCEVSTGGTYVDSETILHWTKEDTILRTENISSKANTFSLDAVSVDDSGRYQCVLESALERVASPWSEVEVYTRIRVTQWPQNIRAVEGTGAEAECAADVDPKIAEKTSITWLKSNQSIATEKSLSGLLKFDELKRSDESVYSCQIENFLERKIIQLRLTVEPKIGVVLVSQHHEYFEQESLTLECRRDNTERKFMTSWYKDNFLIEDESQVNLTINNSKLEDEGSYKCQVQSDIDEAESSLRIRILRKPTLIIREAQMLNAATGTVLNISCQASVEPSLTNSVEWTWTKDNDPLYVEAVQKQVRGKNVSLYWLKS